MAEARINEARLIELFLQLCSFNAPSRQENEIVAWTENYLRQAGFEVWQDRAGELIGGNANNLIAKLPATDPSKPGIFFSAHFDTVEPTAELEVREEQGFFRSSGNTILGADDRAGIAPAIEAVLTARENGVAHGDIYLLFSVAEEIGLLGAAHMDLSDVKADFGFVLDTGPPVGTFVTKAASHDKLTVTITGKPAHSGKDPENGVNAIVVAANAISGMKLGRISPYTTANIGVIHGGSATNVVCAEVTLWAEARSRSSEELDAQIAHMKARFEASALQFGAQVRFDHHRHYEGYDIPDEHPAVQIARAASLALGLQPESRITLGGSDGNVFNRRGLECIVIATGMDKIHTHEEQVSRKDLITTADYAYELIRHANA